MIALTRLVDCPRGTAGLVTKFAGFVDTRPVLEGVCASALGWPAADLIVSRSAGTVSHAGTIVATIQNTGKAPG